MTQYTDFNAHQKPSHATRAILSDADIKRLVKSENIDDRAVATHKICRVMERSELNEVERNAAQEIIRMLAQDAAELVRRALSVTLRTSNLLPHDVAMKLAQDVTSVAIPVISHSPIFSDDDLKEIVLSGSSVRQIAVAKRDRISEPVTSLLAEHAVEEAVAIACANDNAQFSAHGLGMTLNRFASSDLIKTAMTHRAELPVAISEKLVHMVSASLRDHLIKHHAIRPETAMQLSQATQERATLDMADQTGATNDPAQLAKHLFEAGRLTPSLLLRALARGHMGFFEHALSQMSRVPHDRTWLMVHDAGSLGFRAIYDRAGLPARLFPTFKVCVETHHALSEEHTEMTPNQFQDSLIERFLTTVPFAPREDIVYLLEKLDRPAQSNKTATQNEALSNAA